MKRFTTFLSLILFAGQLQLGAQTANDYYTEEFIYVSRPNPASEKFFGGIGTTGIKARIYPGVMLKVEEMVPGSPSEGKFAKGEILTGINGNALKGLNPFVVMGNALTKAEATDGKMIFDVTSTDGKTQRKETVTIPVLGAYSKTWPLDCPKSKRIIDEAAAFYSDPSKFNQDGIPGALNCLFLLSTGDDKYLPRVKAYFDAFPKDVKAIGDHTWNNGYNGIACGEYYLRTGDKSVLPIMQYYCDDAKERQKFDCGWTHWSNGVSPGYVCGSLLNAAGTQLLTVMLLGKECGVNVDEKTLLNALRYHYRFAGHGGAAYGDHRPEGWHAANGKDGMAAAAMRIASGAEGDVTIYQEAMKSLTKGTIDGYLWLVVGHGDEGRSDAIWRSLTTSYLMKEKPEQFHEAMDRLTWWHDLSREPGGSIGVGTLEFGHGQVGHTGAGVGLSYTAPLQTLRITGAPRTKFSQKFTLPTNLWGTKNDRAFLSIEHNHKFQTYAGAEEPFHVLFRKMNYSDYAQPTFDLTKVDRAFLLKNVHHWSYVVRTEAAKTLRKVGALDELEKLLSDPDPRLRRAALDGLIDWNYWFGPGDQPITTEQFTPGMLAAITKMLSYPEESWYVTSGALMALKLAPAKEIQKRYKLIQPWIKHSDWWLREAAFFALTGLAKDDELYVKILPTLLNIATSENHTMPREWMKNHFAEALQNKKPESEAGKLIIAGMKKAVSATEIKSGVRSGEGAYNVMEAVKLCLQTDPILAAPLAMAVQPRFADFSTDDLVNLVGAPSAHPGGNPFGLYTVLEKLEPTQRGDLQKVLLKTYRPELLKRLRADKDAKPELLNSIIDLTKLANPKAGWKAIGKVAPSERTWKFKSFDATEEKDQLPTRERRRFRDFTLPDDLKDWFKPGYDDSQWTSGRAPVGIGTFKSGNDFFTNQSDWGKGEFIVMRTTFDLDALDFDSYRVSILCPQGFRIYLNGHEIAAYGWWQDKPHYAPWSAVSPQHLKTGTNTIAIYSNVAYDESTKAPYGQVDCFIEGLKISDLD